MSDIAFRVVWGDLDLTEAPFSFGFGSDWGAPQSVTSVVASLLVDGEIEMWQRDSNRTLAFAVYVDMGTMTEAAAAEELLVEQARKLRNTIVVEPGDGEAPAAVYDTFRAQVTWVRDDHAEMQGLRHYDITMQAAPAVRAVAPVTIAAISGDVPVTPVTETVDDCTSTTGWTKDVPGTGGGGFGPTVVSGAVTAGYSWPAYPGSAYPTTDDTIVLTRSSLSAPMGGTRYLVVETDVVLPSTGVLTSRTFKINGSAVTPIAQSGTRCYFDCAAIATVNTFEVTAQVRHSAYINATTRVRVHDISRTNVGPFIGSGRQQFGRFAVGGSARTQGSIQISHPTDALGEVAVYTTSDDGSGYQPPLSAHRTGGGTRTPDTSTASGGVSLLNAVSSGVTGEVYEVDADAVPGGTYVFVAAVNAASSSTQVIQVSASTRIGTTDYGTQTDGRYTPVTTSWALQEIGRMTLPPVALPPGTDGKIRINVSSAAAISIDECWMFNLRTGSLTWVRCGTGTPSAGGPSNKLWIDTPTLDWPYPAIWLGTSDTERRSVVVGEESARDIHIIEPGWLNLFLATLGAPNAAADLEYYPRFANNVVPAPA